MTLGDLIERVSALVPLDGVEASRPDALARRRHLDRLRLASGLVRRGVRRPPRPANRTASRSSAQADVAWRHRRRRPTSRHQPGSQCPGCGPPTRGGRLAAAAAIFFVRPSERLTVAGVTGTNGKTTTAYLLASILEAAGLRTRHRRHDRLSDRQHGAVRPTRTTPEAPDVQRLLREMVDAGCAACVMEVSSHALALRSRRLHPLCRPRCSPISPGIISISIGHGGVLRRQAPPVRDAADRPRRSVVNVDDPYGDRLASEFPRARRTRSIGAPTSRPDVIDASLGGLRFDARTPGGTCMVRSRLLGRPNAYNILGAIALASALDVPLDVIRVGCRLARERAGTFPDACRRRRPTSR